MQSTLTDNAASEPDNQQERPDKYCFLVSDDYLVGFTEGEGNFYRGIVPSKETKSGWQVIYYFKVSQNPAGRMILEYFKNRLNCGYIKANSLTDPTDKSLAFVVRDFISIKTKVIPFFENKLIIKKDAFDKFKQVINLVTERKHLSKTGIEYILDIAYSMNTGKRKVTKEFILKAYSSGILTGHTPDTKRNLK